MKRPRHSSNWGGPRPNSGRPEVKPGNSSGITVPAEPKKLALPSADGILQMIEASKRYAHGVRRRGAGDQAPTIFKPAAHPKAAMPSDTKLRMAMDDSLGWAQTEFSGAYLDGVIGEGQTFLGFAYLAELAQRPEYRTITETIADDATRKGIDFEVAGEEEENRRRAKKDPQGEEERMADPDERKKRVARAGKTDKVKALRDDQARLEVIPRFYEALRNDGFFGRSHMFLDFGKGLDIGSTELGSDIGDGRNATSTSKIEKGSFKRIQGVEPVWTYPMTYNALNPLLPDWYNPQVWYVMGTQLHASRLLTLIGHPVPDLLKPAYSFGGLSMSQMAKPYVDIWLTTRQSVADLIRSFSVMVLMMDLSTLTQPGGNDNLLNRATLFNAFRDNMGLFVGNKGTEEVSNVAAPIAGLSDLQAQAQEHMATPSRIPLVKLFGISPKGLNASSEGEIQVYDDTIMAYQNRLIRPPLTKIINFEQLSLWGEIDPEITFVFQPLRELTEKEKGEKQKADSERHANYVDMGVIAPAEVRAIIIDDPELPYTGLDPEDVPDLQEEEDEGLMPGGKQPDGGGGDDGNEDGRPGAEDANVLPFGQDAGWEEGDHPRKDDGKFGSGGGGSKSGGKSAKASESGPDDKPPLPAKGLKRVGEQMGSNPGGVFEDKAGKRFYIKAGRSKEHVDNELAAADLYKLAGAPTLNYRPVEGGGHVATEMAKLDKDNASKLSPAERKRAAEDFVTHAWLANWDSVGTGGDNVGTIGGVPTSLDLGGALTFRARGAPKGAAFGNKVGEIDTMRDPSMSPDAANVYGGMTPDDLRKSAAKVAAVPDEAIRKVIKDRDLPGALADKLIARKADLAARFNLTGDQALDDFNASEHPHAPPGSPEGGQFVAKGSGGSGSGENEPAAPQKEEKAKKTAFGGLWKAGEDNPAANFQMNAAHVLGKPANQGQSYRQMLAFMVKEAPKHGHAALVPALKAKLIEAWQKAGQKLYDEGKMAEATKVHQKLEQMGVKIGAPAAKKPEAKSEPVGAATPEELKKASKTTAVPVPPQSSAEAIKLVQEFNSHYGPGTPVLTTNQSLQQKIDDFKELQAKVALANAKSQAEIQEKAKGVAAKLKAAQAAEAKKHAEANAAVMKDLGIGEEEAEGFNALAQMLGAQPHDVAVKFKKYEQEAAQFGYPISGFQCALIHNYTDGGYAGVNAALRSGSWTIAQDVYVLMVNKALAKMPTYQGALNRGATLNANDQARYKAGHVVEERAFTSCSTGGGFGGNTEFKITAIGKRAASVKKLSNHKSEDEVLYRAHTFFKVTKVDGAPGGHMTVHMTEVDREGT